MSVERSSQPEEEATIWTPDSAWIALRVEATLLAVWSWASKTSRSSEIFTMNTSGGR
jgi:hypothetical protein